VPLPIASLIATVVEGYALVGLLFAIAVLPRRVVRIDPRLAGAPLAVRLLIAPGTAALWPLLAWIWFGPGRRGARS
jgi:hypothetical protein